MVLYGFSGYSTDRVKEFLNDWSEIMNKSRQGKIRISSTASTAYLKLMADGVRYVLLPKSRDLLAQLNPVCYEGAVAGQATAPLA